MVPCLICYTDTKTNTEPTKNNKDKLESQLPPIFIVLKLLGLSQDICCELLSKHGNPSMWDIATCPDCSDIVTQAQHIDKQIFNLQKKLTMLRSQCEFKIVTTSLDKQPTKQPVRRTRSQMVSKIPVADLIRNEIIQCQRFKVPASPIKEIKIEMDSSLDISSPKPVNSVDELDEKNVFYFYDSDEDYFEKVINQTSPIPEDNPPEVEMDKRYIELQKEIHDLDNLNPKLVAVDSSGIVPKVLLLDPSVEFESQTDISFSETVEIEVEIETEPKIKETIEASSYNADFNDDSSSNDSSKTSTSKHSNQTFEMFHFHPCQEPKCQSIFKNVDNLVSHLRHIHKGIQMCKYCFQRFLSWPQLLDHLKSDHSDKLKDEFICDHCPRTCSNQEELNVHIDLCHWNLPLLPDPEVQSPLTLPLPSPLPLSLPLPLKCSECNRVYKNKKALIAHKRFVHQKAWMCEKCPISFSTKTKMIIHQFKEHQVPLPDKFNSQMKLCPVCGKFLSHIRKLERHMATIHNQAEKTQKCPKEGCAFTAFSIYEVGPHVKYVHDKIPRPKRIQKECPECGRFFSGNFSRDLHLKNFHGRTDLPVSNDKCSKQCEKCNKRISGGKQRYLSHLVHQHGEKINLIKTPGELRRAQKLREKRIQSKSRLGK